MIELVIVSRLLEYPDAALWQHQQEMFEANPATAARRWWTCWRSTSSTACS